MMRQAAIHLGVSVAALLLAAGPQLGKARAEDVAVPRAQWIEAEDLVCTCRFKGEHVPIGGFRCLSTPDGPRLHQCVVEQNVTSWRPSGEGCPQALLAVPRG